MIKYPVTLERDPGRIEVHIKDASGRVIADRLIGTDAHEIVEALNAYAAPRSRARKKKIEDQLRESDVTAQLSGGREDVVYGPHDSLPQCGEHVARLRKP